MRSRGTVETAQFPNFTLTAAGMADATGSTRHGWTSASSATSA